MAKNKYSVSEVAGIVESEGLGYAIMGYMNGDAIKDQDLADMWDRASELLKEIEAYIEDNADDVDDSVDIDEDYDPEEDENY